MIWFDVIGILFSVRDTFYLQEFCTRLMRISKYVIIQIDRAMRGRLGI